MAEQTNHQVAPSPTNELENWVRAKVIVLQRGYHDDRSSAVSELAQLRRSARDGDLAPEIWEFLDDLPSSCVGRGDAPSRFERAAATAIGLYAIHQQGQRVQPMHQHGVALGQGLRKLNSGVELDQALGRRFKVLLSADDYDEVVHHLRGLIQQLRPHGIALDYGLLAGDLSNFQVPQRRDSIRRKWARNFYTRPQTEAGDNQRFSQPNNPTGADQ